MGYSDPVDSYTGTIGTLTFGHKKQITVGGEGCLPFYTFEGKMPHKPLVALEVWDIAPDNWPKTLNNIYGDVYEDPVKWARKCVEEFRARAISIKLASTDPNGLDRSPEEAARVVKEIVEAVDVPIIVYGTGNLEKDAEVMKKIAEVNAESDIIIGPAQEDNYKPITAAALGYKKKVIGQAPVDVNIQKQVNILITQLGLDLDRIIMDPTTGALGYGLEYTYSVMERLRIAALKQGDTIIQRPFIMDIGTEVWKIKENKLSYEEAPAMGDPEKRGIAWEAITTMALLLTGADVVILRHPRAAELVNEMIDELM